MSSSHMTNVHVDVELELLTSLYQLDGILEGCRLVEAMPKGFTDQRAG
jgi:hypothetical protein